MRRLFSVLFLCGLVFSSQAYGMSDSGKQKYLDWLKTIGGSDGALAVAPNGCWASMGAIDRISAKRKALKRCKEYCKKTCEIKDVNGTSYFIKQSGSSGSSSMASSSGTRAYCYDTYYKSFYKSATSRCRSPNFKISKREFKNRRLNSSNSSTASSSNKIWCATKYSVSKTSSYSCKQSSGKVFYSYSSALAEKNRLNKSSSSYSSTASSSGTRAYCYDTYYKSFYKSATSRCRSPNFKISKREFKNRRLNSSNSSTASSSSSNKGWCARIGGVRYEEKNNCTKTGGEWFTKRSSAESKRKELKAYSTASSSGSDFVWCATVEDVKFVRLSACRSKGGQSFSLDKSRAQAEHKRLKAASTPVIKTASLTIRSNVNGDRVYIDGNFKGSTRLSLKLPKGRHTIRIEKDGYQPYEESINLTDNLIIRGHLEKVVKQQVQTAAVDSSLELEFWKSVKDSGDPDMFREYLRQFPQGVYAGLAKLKIKKLGGETTSVAKSSIPDLNYGDYYALVIGNNRYDHLGDLRTAVNDARSVANLLELDYGFNVTKLENANRDQIINSISGLRSKVTSEDNVLIYYAGHGVLDEDADEGYWLPVDASRNNPANWVMTDQVVSQVRAMKAKHVMVVADSCFSGTITRGIKIEIKQPTREWLETIVKKKSRTALTSGGLEPVMDSGGGNNSVFANSFLSILRDNDGVLDASQLFSQLRPKVMVNSDQTPEYGDIHRAGHDGGDFLFVRQ